jgi:hypothetical protein
MVISFGDPGTDNVNYVTEGIYVSNRKIASSPGKILVNEDD